MARPRRDGAPPKEPARCEFTDKYLKQLESAAQPFVVRDTRQLGLALIVHPSKTKTFKLTYSRNGQPRWYTIGKFGHITLKDARKIAAEQMLKVVKGGDPHGDRRRLLGAETFKALAERYRDERAKIRNKSWQQADSLVQRYLLPSWGKRKTPTITREDVEVLIGKIEAPILANQVLAAASAIFNWAVKKRIVETNPCKHVDRNPTNKRKRKLSDSEVPLFWAEFNNVLKMLLLTGQRPGEVAAMRYEHIKDGFWEMPGKPVPALNWPGTKNKEDHRVWLPAPARELIGDAKTGAVFAVTRSYQTIEAANQIAMRAISKKLGVEPVRAHDLRRTHGSKITGLGFGRDAMNRIQNHKEGGIADVYDAHEYEAENKKIMETVARAFLTLIEKKESNVVPIKGIPA